MRRILVSGAATWTGGTLVRRLEQLPDTEVLAVDEIEPRIEFDSEVFRYELDHTEFAHFVLETRPDVVIHLQTVDRSAVVGGHRAHEEAVVGAQALFGAIGRCDCIRHVIVRSDFSVYGMGPRNPSVVAEDAEITGPRDTYPNDLRALEQYIATTARRRPGIIFTVLRFAPIFGADVANPISRFLHLPIVPTRLGYDPRLQFISQHDAVRSLEHCLSNPVSGTFNVAAPGQLYLSRVLRLGGRIAQPLPKRLYRLSLRGLSRGGLDVPSHVQRLLRHGIITDTARMQAELGFRPTFSMRQAVLAGFGHIREGEIQP